MEAIEIESKVIKRFIIRDKRDRYLNFISNNKNRKKFTLKLSSFKDFEFKLFEEVKGDESKIIKDKIKVLSNTSDCYLISEDGKLDGQRVGVDEALRDVIGHGMGTIIVFGDSEIVFYEGEGPNNRWISQRVVITPKKF